MPKKHELLTLVATIESELIHYINKRSGRHGPWASAKQCGLLPIAWPFLPIYDGFFRNDLLTKDRLTAARRLLTESETIQENIDASQENFDSTEVQQDFLTQVENLVRQFKKEMRSLNSNYDKEHRTYQEGRDLGKNKTQSIFNRTLFQSQAMLSAEKCDDIINAYKTNKLHTSSVVDLVQAVEVRKTQSSPWF